MISPLLANIVLDVLDQRLTQSGYRFVVLYRSHAQAKQALTFVDNLIRQDLGLSLSPTKTKITNFVEGFEFLGFHLSRRRVSVRHKSIEKFKERVRSLTVRHHNFTLETIQALNRALIGFARYFAPHFASVKDQFALLDNWIRARLRSMKFKRISRGDNRRWLTKQLSRLNLVSLCGQLA